jgi:K+-sensing histidine kinase KdpD
VGHERHIFEAFHRARDDDGKTQAVGLGLYVAYHLARLMGGNLSYQRPRGWTRFELELPDATSQSDVLPRSEVDPAEPSRAGPAAGDTLVPSPQ